MGIIGDILARQLLYEIECWLPFYSGFRITRRYGYELHIPYLPNVLFTHEVVPSFSLFFDLVVGSGFNDVHVIGIPSLGTSILGN